jgi:hypothetical protein
MSTDKPLIYLASPYSHPDKWVERLRWSLVTALGTKLIQDGHHIFGPITESASYADFGIDNSGWNYWGEHDRLMLLKCDKLMVMKLPGWEESKGVQAEIKIATAAGMPIDYVDPLDILPELEEVI